MDQKWVSILPSPSYLFYLALGVKVGQVCGKGKERVGEPRLVELNIDEVNGTLA